MKRAILGVALATFAIIGLSPARAEYPERPITAIIPFAAGGASDTIFRAAAEELRSILGQPIIIENISGASGLTGVQAAFKAPKDGYTILIGNSNSNGTTPIFYKNKFTFDVNAEFSVVSPLADGPAAVLTTSKNNFNVTSYPELIQWAKSGSGKLRVGSSGLGTGAHLAVMKMVRDEKLEAVHIPIAGGGGDMLIALTSGDVQATAINVSTILPHIQAGTVNAVAVDGPSRIPELPNVPTFTELGHPEVTLGIWHAVFVAKAVPQPVKDKLFSAIQAALKTPRLVELMKKNNFIPVDVESPADGQNWKDAHVKAVQKLIDETPKSQMQ